MRFCFGWANAAADVPACDFVILWHLKLGDEFDGVSTGWHLSADSLGEAAEFVGKGMDSAVESFDNVSIFLHLACDRISDGVGEVCGYDIGDSMWCCLL